MFRKVHRHTRLFFLLTGISLIAIIVTFTPTSAAQNSVPPTAVQAAKMPQFASRLAHPAKRLLPPKAQPPQRPKTRRGPLDSTTIYENGPIDGNTDAWVINFGFVVSDTFNIASNSTQVTGGTFAMWFFLGDTLTSAELSITSGINGGTSYFDQTVNFTMGNCTNNEYGYDVCTVTTSFAPVTLSAGTYFLNLQNASLPSGDPVYWEENSGVGCQSPGCPSQADQNSVGSIPSEAFTILGEATTTTTTFHTNYSCPRPQRGFRDINVNAAGSTGNLAVDSAGNLYGTNGEAPNGLLFELAQRAGRWFYSSLYNFLGGSDGSASGGVIVGPEGGLFGAASGGIQSCGTGGTSYCGLIYEARPGPTACATALCRWNESTLYQFSGNSDAWNGTVAAFDSAGNLYGISQSGGVFGYGAVFELTPRQGAWAERILYSFMGGDDGGGPNSLLVGHDGTLYGTAGIGGHGYGVAFQLVPSGGGWRENVIYAFTGAGDGYAPAGLIQDSAGGLYGYASCYENDAYQCTNGFPYEVYGLIFRLWHTGARWSLSVVQRNNLDCQEFSTAYHALSMDAAGHLYAAEGSSEENCDPDGCSDYSCGNIIEDGLYRVAGNADIFYNLASDADGNLYGTTQSCGFETPRQEGPMIWQYSP